jgi:hypothetical protein
MPRLDPGIKFHSNNNNLDTSINHIHFYTEYIYILLLERSKRYLCAHFYNRGVS